MIAPRQAAEISPHTMRPSPDVEWWLKEPGSIYCQGRTRACARLGFITSLDLLTRPKIKMKYGPFWRAGVSVTKCRYFGCVASRLVWCGEITTSLVGLCVGEARNNLGIVTSFFRVCNGFSMWKEVKQGLFSKRETMISMYFYYNIIISLCALYFKWKIEIYFAIHYTFIHIWTDFPENRHILS